MSTTQTTIARHDANRTIQILAFSAVETARSVGTLSAERGWGYIPNCAPGTGAPIATFVRLEQGEWIIPIDKDHHPKVPRDVAIYDDEMGARLEARHTWRG